MIHFEDGTDIHVIKLYCAASQLVETVVTGNGKAFTREEASRLGDEILDRMESFCQPGMSDSIPRTEMEVLVSRIFSCIAKSTKKRSGVSRVSGGWYGQDLMMALLWAMFFFLVDYYWGDLYEVVWEVYERFV